MKKINRVFFGGYTEDCANKIRNNVSHILKGKFGEESKFVQLVLETLAFRPEDRPNAEKLVEKIKKIIDLGNGNGNVLV